MRPPSVRAERGKSSKAKLTIGSAMRLSKVWNLMLRTTLLRAAFDAFAKRSAARMSNSKAFRFLCSWKRRVFFAGPFSLPRRRGEFRHALLESAPRACGSYKIA
jgi:hypothetical protein